MLTVQPRRWLSRPRGLLVFAILVASLYWLLLHGSATPRVTGWVDGHAGPVQAQGDSSPVDNPNQDAAPNDQSAEVQAQPDGKTDEERQREENDRREDNLRAQFSQEYDALAKEPGADALFGNTLNTLDADKESSLTIEAHLTPAENLTYYSSHQPYVYNPYPRYNEKTWLTDRAQYVPCNGPDGTPVKDILVFQGQPKEFPKPLFGNYDTFGMDGNLCYERETRLGPYGYQTDNDTTSPLINWDKVRWGQLQEKCVQKNKARFNMQGHSNPYLSTVYSRGDSTAANAEVDAGADATPSKPISLRRGDTGRRQKGQFGQSASSNSKQIYRSEGRTALLLRTYTGKEYSENDKQVIRAMITELSLRTGGQYQVFLFVHVKDTSFKIWDDEGAYEYVLGKNVPAEFRDIAVLWNDDATQAMYPRLDPGRVNVHVSQWLSVQKFSQEYPEFDFVWNWEIDARVTGHHYDFLEKLAAFGKRQPRRGLWERNERFYIPSYHGDYDTKWRKEVERIAGKDTVWGPPELPFITPVGPKPPVANPEDDNYKWGVGEEADLITVAPIFNPVNSAWVSVNELWGFEDENHATLDLPRRATIITHSRVSKRLLDIMHVENLRGNHISSEMATQTTALLHGLKAVYAPHPVFFDRPWKGEDLARWFNGGPKGESGSFNSAMGWGREARYGGSTWYYRANPPQRLYLNFMGWEDTGVGGAEWEEEHGRTCLPPLLMHPIKDILPTTPGYKSESHLPYD
ncbi:hypothetical protein F4779DRAFT_17036 [Xylariaceae sp. FL0662B]|nr:hypothetical protein F4779DRAFT_17036 [Xylariaceae sp. FL0662B]